MPPTKQDKQQLFKPATDHSYNAKGGGISFQEMLFN